MSMSDNIKQESTESLQTKEQERQAGSIRSRK